MTYGDYAPNSKVLLCLPGLNRNGHDFTFLAEYLSQLGYYIIAPDLPGRGASSYLQDTRGYTLESNIADILQLLEQLQIEQFSVLGVSLGGIIAMCLAALPQLSIEKLVLSDIGAEIEPAGLSRIAAYHVQQPTFTSYVDASAYLRAITANEGIYNEQVWQHLFKHTLKINREGSWELNRDPQLGPSLLKALKEQTKLNFWQEWEKIKSPTLLIHGVHSDIVSGATLDTMQQINPFAERMTIKDAGHAPYIYRKFHIRRIANFLLRHA